MGLRRANRVAWRRVGDETVLIHLENKQIFVLNECAEFLWHALDGTRSAREMLDALPLDEPPPDTAPEHIEAFLQELESAGLVASSDGPGDATVKYPGPSRFPRFVAPALVWQEQLRNFGQSCARESGESGICDVSPTF